MVTLLDDDLEERGDLSLSAPAFDDGERMPDYVGTVNENDNPELRVEGVPDGAESLVLVLDDPDTRESAGFVFDHWLVWNVDPGIGTVPRDWDAAGATVGYNDLVHAAYDGPAPPAEHAYRFKLLALDGELDLAPEARKAVLDSRCSRGVEILASAQLVGTYHPDQGTVF